MTLSRRVATRLKWLSKATAATSKTIRDLLRKTTIINQEMVKIAEVSMDACMIAFPRLLKSLGL